ncbi:hypothetical protein [Acidithiobacillus thiooxidans]|uniref:Uncharacterized protein n=1 Tax=Acidithiobacillus thiooxidans ATCC 19377 TaxID=637390 RepID=A0A543Q6J6_ACITH|nr:hypothetical protein [Acidithiobacillus thiooxidans]MDX5933829.1 hypothetical protein [Acidithiobacillus thiooxidans]TQN51954.1 hypothetical protein DLNHIDIE_01835 [Acidithiobacillus thiooxidans ATCC 19377]
MNNLCSFTKPLFAVFSVLSLLIPAVSHADSEYMAQQAHQTCLEYGAKPGTRLFYRCMKSQMRKEQYNHANNDCVNDQSIQSQCDMAIIGKPDPFQAFANCKSDLVARCERQASNEYLHRNNAQKYDLNIHDYNHNYNGH